ncbi:hypothetical protein BGW39_000910 [Mortierella sp. 14UC]|nr:hypothetical protein BGW39_000910 [Mortierella sp. 14UC]
MTGITDLPQELISMVADYLNRKDRTRFAGTCRNHYQALITHLWKQVHVESDFPHYGFTNVPITPVKPFIASSRLEQYATHVNLLGLHGPFQSDHYAIKFPRLHTLMFQYDSEFHAPSNHQGSPDTLDGTLDATMLAETHVNNANLIRLNPTIKNLQMHLRRPEFQPFADFWEAVATTLDNPNHLNITGIWGTGGDTLDSFWKACTLFQELSLDGGQVDYTTLLPRLAFPRLQRITLNVFSIWDGRGFNISRQVAWFRQCPNLTKLDWKTTSSILSNESFLQALEQKVWPHLEDLSLGNFRFRVDLGPMLSRLPPLRRFRLVTEVFSQFDFRVFREQLFGKIRVLDMAHSFGFSSLKALSVLEECVHLEEFKSLFIDAEEIDIKKRPWVCHGLKHLEILILAESEESNEQAFEALSRLTNLEYMDFGPDKITVSDIEKYLPEDYRCLQWSLDSGLERLSTLKKVRNLGFASTEQEMMEEDLEWMLDNWPLLEEVKGEFSGDAGYHNVLVDMLKERHIAHF